MLSALDDHQDSGYQTKFIYLLKSTILRFLNIIKQGSLYVDVIKLLLNVSIYHTRQHQ